MIRGFTFKKTDDFHLHMAISPAKYLVMETRLYNSKLKMAIEFLVEEV